MKKRAITVGEVWQRGNVVASCEGRDKKAVERETAHYAMVYAQDGPVEVKFCTLYARYRTKP